MEKFKKYCVTTIFVLSILGASSVSAQKTLLDTLIGGENGEGKTCSFIYNGKYMPFTEDVGSLPLFGKLVSGGCVDVTQNVANMFETGFKVFLGIVSLIAVVNIAVAGIQYIFQEQSPGSKSAAKKKLTSSIIGLIIAFSSWVILNTVNSKLTDVGFDLTKGPLADLVEKGVKGVQNFEEVQGECIQGTVCGAAAVTQGDGKGTPVSGAAAGQSDVNYGSVQGLLTTAQNVSQRAINGDLNISLYSHSGDSTTDSNTATRRGNNNNLLVDGSVALSPDLVSRLQPKPGQEIYVGNTLVGYFDDTTGRVAGNGRAIVNTVDIYNPTGALGNTNTTLKVIQGGKVSLGTKVRAQTKNP